MKTYYKVVYAYKGKLLSVGTGPGQVVYPIGEWANPLTGNGPLCVYDNLDNIVGYAGDREIGFRIYECEIEPSAHWYAWYQVLDGKVISHHRRDLLRGTVLAERVRLTKEIRL